jgi:hypothetical protein
MALALEHRYEPFSQGRGFITPPWVNEIKNIAACHGIVLAPLHNADGLLETAPHSLPLQGAGILNKPVKNSTL